MPVEKVMGKRGWGYGESYVPVSFEAENLKRNTVHEVLLTGMNDSKEGPGLTGRAI